MKQWSTALILLAVLGAQVMPVHADDLKYRPAASQQHGYMVSVVLRKGEEGVVIKLVHGMSIGATKDEAIGAFVDKTLHRHPGYSLIDSIATLVPHNESPCGPAI